MSELADLVKQYVLSRGNPRADYEEFVEYAKKILPPTNNDLRFQLIPLLKRWEGRGSCSIRYDRGEILSFETHDYYPELVSRRYDVMQAQLGVAFPKEASLGFTIPGSRIHTVNVDGDFVDLLTGDAKSPIRLLRINFPEHTSAILALADQLESHLIYCAVAKAREYMQDTRNLTYLQNHLRPIMRGREMALRDLFKDISTSVNQAMTSLSEASDFGFKFWAHCSGLIVQDFADKSERLEREDAYCQAAYLIRYYIVWRRGIVHREAQKQSDLKELEKSVRKPPYAFTLTDLYAIPDSKGIPLARKYDQGFVHEFVKGRTKPDKDARLPFLVHLKADVGKEYFVQRDLLIPVFVSKLHEAGEELRDTYVAEWARSLRSYERLDVMKKEDLFSADMDSRVRETFPLLSSLLDPNLLFVAREGTEYSATIAGEVARCFGANGKMRPLPVLMRLHRDDLLVQARSSLPLWHSIEPIATIVYFLMRLVRGSPEAGETESQGDEEYEAASAELADRRTDRPVTGRHARQADNRQQYRQAIRSLRDFYVGTSGPLDDTLEELAEKWNPLFDADARVHLVEDVDSFVRDYLKKFKRGFLDHPPDADRIRKLAEELSRSPSFLRIRRRETFRRYLELAMVKALESWRV